METEKQKIGFNDLSLLLKMAVLGGVIQFIWGIAMGTLFIAGFLMVALGS